MKIGTLLAFAAITAAPQMGFASHANSWAGETDAVLSQNHEDNQARSADTPGEDEMNGLGARASHGKNGTTPNGGTASENSGLGGGTPGGGHGGNQGGGNR